MNRDPASPREEGLSPGRQWPFIGAVEELVAILIDHQVDHEVHVPDRSIPVDDAA